MHTPAEPFHLLKFALMGLAPALGVRDSFLVKVGSEIESRR